MNNMKSMNIESLSELALKEALTAKLQKLGGGVDWLQGWKLEPSQPTRGFDIQAKVSLPNGTTSALYVECKRDVRPSSFLALADKPFFKTGLPRGGVPVLGAPWISPRVADLCTERGWSWFDLAGNYRLDIPGLLHLQNTGNKPVFKRPSPTANLSTPEAARVMRALLAPEQVGVRWTQREIQRCCQPSVSLGLVNKMARYLRDEAFVEATQADGFRLRDPQKLLEAWRDAYRFDQNRRKSYFTLLQGNQLRNALAQFGARSDVRAAYAAFSAAEIQAPHVRQPKTWIYVREQDVDLFAQQIEAKPVDSGENVVLLVPPDDGVFYLPYERSTSNGLACTNPVQTYVDLFYCGGRGQEAAEALLEQRLKPEWKKQGIP